MARFLKHIACSFCGSRNNRGVYDDGSEWCFGGGKSCHPKGGTISPLVAQAKHGNDSNGVSHSLPSDASVHIGPSGLQWLKKYDIPIETLIKEGVRWSEERQQLLFTFPPTEFFQARNFREGKSKYFTSGSHEDVLPIFPSTRELDSLPCLVLTEDCLSAIKVATSPLNRGTHDAMPLLGTNLPTSKLMRLKRLGYKNILCWLDHDKGREAMSIVQRCRLVGLDARVVVTELDPKELSYDELTRHLTTRSTEKD